ncbi:MULTISPECIES: hypothetical protein [unclassified Nonomuraea]|uniref:hypothetical protein n=1 Tax=unclassified Nonomuraea TaxID=2593643 RepID=UPI003261162E
MRALLTRLRRPAGISGDISGVTFNEATSEVCDRTCRAEAAIERARTSALSSLSFR